MKMSKRIISLLLSLVLIGTAAVFAADETASFEPAEHMDTVAFLRAMGIIDEGFTLSSSSAFVTRGEFAKLISEVMLTGASNDFEAKFTDVPAGHIYAPYIYAVCKAGYMNGTSDTTFNPDESVYHEQAVSVCVKLAGYDMVAKSMGSYPDCYLAQASGLGLLENVASVMGTPISRGNLTELIYNTLLCDMMIIDGYGDNGSYVIYEGKNILSQYHNIKKGTGIVNADNYYSMTENHSGEADAVIIEGVKYYKNDISILNDSVGRCIDFYYRTDSGRKTVLYSEKKDTAEVIFNIDSSLSLDAANGVYKYHENDKLKEYRLSDFYDVIYNMEELLPVTEARLLPPRGTITLIDNTGDGRYDVVIVDEFYNLVVDMYNKNLNVISDISDLSRNLNLDDIDSYRIFDKSGSEISPDKIKTGSVIEVYKSASGDRLTAIVNSGIVSGKYTEQTYDGNIVVEGAEYKLSSDLRSDVLSLTLGNEYDFGINAKGEIAYWTLGDGYKQGYVLEVGQAGTLDKKVSVKILAQNSKVEIYDLADKVKSITPGGTTTYDKLNYSSIFTGTYNPSAGANVREFILYQLNDKNEIISVVHAMEVNDHDEFSNLSSYPLYRLDLFAEKWIEMGGWVYPKWKNSSADNPSMYYFKKGINGFDNMLIFSDDAKVYKVPAVSADSVDERNVSVNQISGSYDTDYKVLFTEDYQGKNSTMMTYIVGDNYPYPNVMIEHTQGAGSSVSDEQISVTVVDIRSTYNKETREEATFIEAWNGESMVNIYINDESQISWSNFEGTEHGSGSDKESVNMPSQAQKPKIEIGDIIKYASDEAGNLSVLALMYDGKNDKLCYKTDGFGDQYNLARGVVTKVRNNFVEVQMDITYEDSAGVQHSGTAWEILNVSTLPSLIVDLSKNKAFVGSYLDIEVGDTILRYSKSSSNRYLTVYKN